MAPLKLLAAAPGYRVWDMRCSLGPKDPINENAYPAYRVAAIVGGTFKIRSTLGDAVPVVGSLLLGNACDCYCCSHHTPNGDRCINFDFEAEFLERARSELGAPGIGERFPRRTRASGWTAPRACTSASCGAIRRWLTWCRATGDRGSRAATS